jgi:hypothetical protein
MSFQDYSRHFELASVLYDLKEKADHEQTQAHFHVLRFQMRQFFVFGPRKMYRESFPGFTLLKATLDQQRHLYVGILPRSLNDPRATSKFL